MEWFILIAALFLAFSNGANDNFKGFATVWGSDTLNYRQALRLATLATVAGCFAALFLAETLLQNFSGKGLVADAVAATRHPVQASGGIRSLADLRALADLGVQRAVIGMAFYSGRLDPEAVAKEFGR
mgnify:CR=1 FL=1